uniref:Secreted protein n=1 Tax=Acrobeloides nanus TaxID=290746 RepID=A0A914EFP6_9BILA
MRSFCPIFLCFVLVFLVQALAKVVPVGQDVHLRGYGGDDSYGSYESYESSSESSSSESSSCELPEPRKECPTAGASYAPLFVAHGTLNWLGEYTQVEPPVICDCDTGAKLFFTDKPNDGIPSSMQDAQDKDIMSYTLNNDRYCPHMCLRDTNGKFWVPKSNDPPSTVVFITTVCAS